MWCRRGRGSLGLRRLRLRVLLIIIVGLKGGASIGRFILSDNGLLRHIATPRKRRERRKV
jgi:hypothetical protein